MKTNRSLLCDVVIDDYRNLAQNLFRAIPPAIFKHMTLRELYVLVQIVLEVFLH